jgi:hypothetical protein
MVMLLQQPIIECAFQWITQNFMSFTHQVRRYVVCLAPDQDLVAGMDDDRR